MKKKAFTLLELVFAIVILGIVAMIGTDVISQMYQGYIKSKSTNKLQSKTAQVLDIITTRLGYRIKDTAVTSINGALNTYLKLNDPSISAKHNILEWIGYDNEGMIGEWDSSKKRFSGWSGFIDLDNPSTTNKQFVTSGSRLDFAREDILSLSDGEIDLNQITPKKSAAIIFKCKSNNSIASYGYLGASHTSVYKVKRHGLSNEILDIEDADTSDTTIDYCEQYYLVWSAYAIVPEGDNENDFNLTLRYNYQPWENERYTQGKKTILSEHVTTFRFIQIGSKVRVKLCLKDPQTNFSFCKEQAVE